MSNLVVYLAQIPTKAYRLISSKLSEHVSGRGTWGRGCGILIITYILIRNIWASITWGLCFTYKLHKAHIIKIIDNFSSIHHLYFSALHVFKLSGKNVCRQLYPKENYSYKMFIQSSYNCLIEQLRSYSFITTSIHLDNCVLQATYHNPFTDL